MDTSELPHYRKCIRPPMSPLYPLPPDYALLSGEEQRWWRVNACSIQDQPSDLTIAFTFFFFTYLWPDEAAFLENKRKPLRAHYQLVHDLGAFKFNGFGAPREFAKSTLSRILAMLVSLTRRGYRTALVYPVQDACRDSLSLLRDQFTNNPLLRQDFGEIVPRRGERMWSQHHLQLSQPFMSRIRGMWMKGAQRGGRFDLGIIDDAETDPKTGEVVPEYTAALEKSVFKVYAPMMQIVARDLRKRHLAARGSSLLLMGTVIEEQMLLARILSTASGSKYDFWNRRRLMAHNNDKTRFLWPERYGAAEVDLLREVLGADVFDSEFMNRPGHSSAGYIDLHPVYHTYDVHEMDSHWHHAPEESGALIRMSWRPHPSDDNAAPIVRSIPAADWFGGMQRAIIIDWAGESLRGSLGDYHCLHALGQDADYVLWSLDMAMFRGKRDAVCASLMQMCLRWKPRILFMDSTGGYSHLSEWLFNTAKDRLMDALGWVPMPIFKAYNMRAMNKGARIARIVYRFKMDRIRLPGWRLAEWPYNALAHQCRGFTPTLAGLANDDAIDTLGMTPEVFRGPGFRIEGQSAEAPSVISRIEGGQVMTADGHLLVQMLPEYSHLTPAAEAALDAAAGSRSRPQWKRPLNHEVAPLRFKIRE